MIKIYSEAVEYIFSLSSPKNLTHTPGMHLERIRKFLDYLGNPQDSYPIIHIGGTAGKGSTSYLTAKILAAMGYKVGIHTSPYLVTLNEKFSIISPPLEKPACAGRGEGGILEPCTNEELIDLVNWYINQHSAFSIQHSEGLTFYEAIITMVFKHFSNQKVDVAVIEVALGGRYDATNVVNSDVAVLTSVGLDHTQILGNTVEEITNDKMRIMKPGKTFISGLRDEKLNSMILNYSKELESPIKIIGKDFDYEIITSNLYETNFTYIDRDNQLIIDNCKLSLTGDFQAHNASLAIEAVSEFMKNNLDCYPPVKGGLGGFINEAFSTAKIPARFDIIQKSPLIILDGAHNELKMRKFVESLKKLIGDSEVDLLFSCSDTKDLQTIIEQLLPLNIKRVYLSEFSKQYYKIMTSYPNSLMNETFIKVFGEKIKIDEFNNPIPAYNEFKKNIKPDRVGIVTGSLYLLGNIYENILLEPK